MNDQRDGGINWTDYTWNGVTGCLNDCPYCYARALYVRNGMDFTPTLHPERLGEPFAKREPRKIFVCSTADLFGTWVKQDWIDAILHTVRQCPQHTFQFLTKNPARLPTIPWPDNCWVGATVDEVARLQPSLDALQQVRAPVRFISFEPLNSGMGAADLSGIQWAIIGPQTGKDAHQPQAGWVNELIHAARLSGTAIWMKDNLTWPERLNEWPLTVSLKQLALAI